MSGAAKGNGAAPHASVAAVLPGGGARGAYEIGALSVLLPALEARGERVAVWCGTSVGAINAAVLASLADLPASDQCSEAATRWQELRKRDVIAPIAGSGGIRTLARLVGNALGVPGIGLASLLDPSPLSASLDRWVDWARLARNVDSRVVEAVCVVATSLSSGDPVGFVASRNGAPAHLDDGIRYVGTRLRGEHVRASAAIPLLFPTVEITTPRSDRGHYVDGGTRLNSPIKPALNLGAEKVIVIGLEPFAAGAGRSCSSRAPSIADVGANVLDGLSWSTRSRTTCVAWRRSTRSSSRTPARGRCPHRAPTGWPAVMRRTGRSPMRWSLPAAGERSGASPRPCSSAGTAACAACARSTTW